MNVREKKKIPEKTYSTGLKTFEKKNKLEV